MCEPMHSITQFPDQDPDSGRPTDMLLRPEQKQEGILKRILRWFHFSRMGSGHHESIINTPLQDRAFQSIGAIKYEAEWWNRGFHMDNDDWRDPPKVEYLQIDCAHEYAKRVSIGGLPQLRRFLEATIRQTDRPWMYIEYFRRMLNKAGKMAFEQHPILGSYTFADRRNLDKKVLIPSILGFTRKRHLLVPEWADDTSLWSKGE